MKRLQALRKSLGFKDAEVAAAARWPLKRLREIEDSDDPEAQEADILRDLYGVDIEGLLSESEVTAKTSPVAGLLYSQSSTLDADTRFSLATSAIVAREVRHLQEMVGEGSPRELFESFRHNPDYAHPREGTPQRLAEKVRSDLQLGDEPISSLSSDVLPRLGVLTLWERVAPDVEAFSFIDSEGSPVFVLNLDGRHTRGVFGRRIALAHELCHVLFDRPKMSSMGRMCELDQPSRMRRDPMAAVEQRARAFAVHLLLPAAGVRRVWRGAGGDVAARIRLIMETFGAGYEAVRSQLKNLGLYDLSTPVLGVPVHAPPVWEESDPMPTLDPELERAGVPIQRATLLPGLVSRALSQGKISESRARELLRVSVGGWEAARSRIIPPEGSVFRTSSRLLEADG